MFLVASLAACASGSLLSEVSSAVWSGKQIQDAELLTKPLNPNYQYLRAELDGQSPALLVLGYVDAHPLGEIEVWYSAKGEVLRLQNGRVVGSTGLSVDWQQVSFSPAPPAWLSVPENGAAFVRFHDQSPGYRLGISEQVKLTRSSNPPVTPLTSGMGDATMWFRETYSDTNHESLPEAWFALGRYRGKTAVIYSHQCLSSNVCLTLQRWPLEKAPL